MGDPLLELLSLPQAEKLSRGLTDTPREIYQQPETWLETLRRLSSRRAEMLAFLQEAGIGTAAPPDLILAGAGTSDYIGRAVSRVLREQWQCPVHAVASTELLTNMDDSLLPGRSYLCISFSRSGESSEGVAVLEQMLARRRRGVRHVVVTCNASSTMARLPGVFPLVLDEKVNDRGLAMTSSFTNMVAAGQYLAYIRTPGVYESLLGAVAESGRTFLAAAAEMTSALAKKGFRRVCFLGTGSLQAVAKESALKVLELNAGRIATLAQSALGLRHGPLSFLNAETLVVAYLSSEPPRAAYELDLLEELRGKVPGVEILIVAEKATPRLRAITDLLLTIDASRAIPDACRGPVDVMAAQLLALFLSIENGITPDTPSAGAISRVVSGVRIYSAVESESR